MSLEFLIPPHHSLAGAPSGAPTLTHASSTVTRQNGIAPGERVRNRLLSSLPAIDFEQIRSKLESVKFERRQVMYEPETPIRHVYFPETTVVSLVTLLRGGATVEIGTAGYEGMAGLPLFLGDETSTVRAFAQIPGTALRLSAADFQRFAASGAFHDALLRYTMAFLTQVAQTAACNGSHVVEERCARWLLMTHDRVDGDEFPLTHEFMAFMLGVRRAGVTIAMRALQDAGVIRYTRGWVHIIDRAKLELTSCECYLVVREHLDRLLPRSATA